MLMATLFFGPLHVHFTGSMNILKRNYRNIKNIEKVPYIIIICE
jgi:hypothetical protein